MTMASRAQLAAMVNARQRRNRHAGGALGAILGIGGADFADFNFSNLSTLFQDDAGVTPVTADAQLIGRANAIRRVPRYGAQSVAAAKGSFLLSALKLDGVDDNLLTDFYAQTGANCVVCRTRVPATIAATSAVAGLYDAAGANAIYLGVTTTGLARCRIGATILTGTTDLRDTEAVLCATTNGATARLFVNGVQEGTSAQTGGPLTNLPYRIGGSNWNGALGNAYGGHIRNLALGRVNLSLDDFQRIRAQWLAV